jgi:hypothetical protein
MSDGSSDLGRDQDRSEATIEMWRAFGAFAISPSPERREEIIQKAKAVDLVRGGYWGGRTKHASLIIERIEGIERRDSGTWALLILQVAEFDPEFAAQLQAKSPIADSLVGAVEIRGNEVRFAGPAAQAIAASITAQVGDAGRQLIVLLPNSATKLKIL